MLFEEIWNFSIEFLVHKPIRVYKPITHNATNNVFKSFEPDVWTSVLACCVEMPIWKHKVGFDVQHNTQIHTQAKTAKMAKKYTKIHKFLGPF